MATLLIANCQILNLWPQYPIQNKIFVGLLTVISDRWDGKKIIWMQADIASICGASSIQTYVSHMSIMALGACTNQKINKMLEQILNS